FLEVAPHNLIGAAAPPRRRGKEPPRICFRKLRLFSLRHQLTKQRRGTRIPAATSAATTGGSAATTAACSSCDLKRCTALLILFVEPGAFFGDVLDDGVRTTRGGVVHDGLSVCIKGVHINAVVDEQFDGVE